MPITNAFRTAVATGDAIGIRIMMKDSLLVDPTFAEFSEMDKLTHGISGLYDSHDGRELEQNRSAWNDDYMNKLMVQVVGNFSHDRVNHLKQVVRHLRPVASTSQTREPSGGSRSDSYTHGKTSNRSAQPLRPNYQQQKWLDRRNNRIRTTRIATGAVAGGVVGGAAAAVAGGSFVAGAAVGAVVVGAVVWIATNRR